MENEVYIGVNKLHNWTTSWIIKPRLQITLESLREEDNRGYSTWRQYDLIKRFNTKIRLI